VEGVGSGGGWFIHIIGPHGGRVAFLEPSPLRHRVQERRLAWNDGAILKASALYCVSTSP
jgi:hypothetical protein